MKIAENLYGFIWNNPTANNCNSYLIKGNKNILIDPGHDHLFQHVHEGLGDISMAPKDIDLVIITHAHPDHMEGVRRFVGSSTLIAMSQVEMDFIKNMAPHYGNALDISGFEPHILLQEGSLKVADMSFQVIHSPGHSPGSLCLHWIDKKALFTGDVVFYNGLGRTDIPGGDGKTLKESIKKISRLDLDYLLPGHGEAVSGRDQVQKNFQQIEDFWFAYL
jgi:glyoxylase-like metal-dependent hydrolase (beta-lactamase superfamily II)